MRVGELLRRLLVGVLVVAGSAAAAIWLLGGDSGSPAEAGSTAATHPTTARIAHPGGKPAPAHRSPGGDRGGSQSLLASGAAASWDALERSTPARMGVVVAPLGGGPERGFGPLQTGHAWSTIKVPIIVTLMREQGTLGAEEEGWARAALTASDNEAAAALFGRLEEAHGGLAGASRAVEGTLRRAGDSSTVVATAPPPPGAVSTFGQTDWSLRASTEFLAALARNCLLSPSGTDYVLGLMEEVIPEQRWGLGEASFPASWRLAIKGGWGPEGSASGPYLVRQMGIVGDGDAGAAVALIARADSGSFEAGVEALDRISAWLQQNLAGMSTPKPC